MRFVVRRLSTVRDGSDPERPSACDTMLRQVWAQELLPLQLWPHTADVQRCSIVASGDPKRRRQRALTSTPAAAVSATGQGKSAYAVSDLSENQILLEARNMLRGGSG